MKAKKWFCGMFVSQKDNIVIFLILFPILLEICIFPSPELKGKNFRFS